MTQSKAKERRAEREVAMLLASWWQILEPMCEFKPTPLGGKWRGRDYLFRASGDLMTTADEFPFTVKVNHCKDWSMDDLVAGKRQPVWDWWIQSQRLAAEEGGVPMLWFKKNQYPWLVAVPQGAGLSYPNLIIPQPTLTEKGIDYGPELPVFVFADRLLYMGPSTFVK
jgi:hypothetical protein